MQITQAHTDTQTTNQTTNKLARASLSFSAVERLLTKRSFAMLSTISPAGHPHGASVLYEYIDGDFYINTLRSSRKARNIAASGLAAMCIPVRRLPVGPPSSIHFQAKAELLDLDAPPILELIEHQKLKSLTSHGELELIDGCFLRISPGPRLLTHGLGMSLRRLIADPLNAGGVVYRPEPS